MFLTDFSSVLLYVHVWACHDLPGSGPELGWTDDNPLLLGSLRDGHVSGMYVEHGCLALQKDDH